MEKQNSESPKQQFTIFIAQEGTAVSSILAAARRSVGAFIIVAPASYFSAIRDEEIRSCFRECKALNIDRRLTLACKDKRVLEIATEAEWETVSTVKALRLIVKGHPSAAPALRAFSPVSWSQDIRSQLQSAGILALPKTRIWSLFIVSGLVFLFVFLRLLPSATITLTPSQETQSFTTNVYLVASGALELPVDPAKVRTLPMILLTVPLDRTITYDQISKEFTGTNASMTVTIYNNANEQYSLRKGTRIINQAGMVFRLQDPLIMGPKSSKSVVAEAESIDVYGEVLGERGNVPGGLKWEFVGLDEASKKLVFGRNEAPASGGKTAYETVLKKEDLIGALKRTGAKQRLEQELLSVAKQQAEDERLSINQLRGTNYVQLDYEELTKIMYKDFQLSEEFVGQHVSSVPVHGAIEYTIILYDENALLNLLSSEVYQRTPENTVVAESSLSRENIDLHVIAPWDDDFRWVKITADLSYNLRYVFDPITPVGASFGKHIRSNVAGKTVEEAYRVLRNLPEVATVQIRVWPPWSFTLPTLESNIVVKEQL